MNPWTVRSQLVVFQKGICNPQIFRNDGWLLSIWGNYVKLWEINHEIGLLKGTRGMFDGWLVLIGALHFLLYWGLFLTFGKSLSTNQYKRS